MAVENVGSSDRRIGGAAPWGFGRRCSLLLVVLTLLGSFVSGQLLGATAVARVSAHVLGHADADVASGAVTVTKVSDLDSSRIEPSRNGAATMGLSTFRVGGGHDAVYTVALPEAVTVKSGDSEIRVSRFRANGTTGRLAADGTAVIAVEASVAVPASQSSGSYAGSYAVTIAYD
ncbi:MAG: DUF4402 domain-containing protein [Acidobacteriota bacterium]|nr:DUF4402 domain-containing protein [Acidobacteriota bacterium]